MCVNVHVCRKSRNIDVVNNVCTNGVRGAIGVEFHVSFKCNTYSFLRSAYLSFLTNEHKSEMLMIHVINSQNKHDLLSFQWQLI